MTGDLSRRLLYIKWKTSVNFHQSKTSTTSLSLLFIYRVRHACGVTDHLKSPYNKGSSNGGLSVPSHYMNQWRLIVKWAVENKFKWILNQNVMISFKKFFFENVICKMVTILSGPHWNSCVIYSLFSIYFALIYQLASNPLSTHYAL